MARLSIFFILILYISNPLSVSSDEWNRYYLATYPRSGNHWLRYMIEDATFIVTSSVYTDADIKFHNEFGRWEANYAPGGYRGRCRDPSKTDPVIVKTHFPAVIATPFDLLPYKKVIRVIRHPIDAIYSWFLYAGGKKGEKIPTESLIGFIEKWKIFQEYWDTQPNVVTIYYENMLVDQQHILTEILLHIGAKVNENDINRAVFFNSAKGSPLKHLKYFCEEDLNLINRELGELMQKHGYSFFK